MDRKFHVKYEEEYSYTNDSKITTFADDTAVLTIWKSLLRIIKETTENR